MNVEINKKRGEKYLKKLFLIDGFGAILSAFLLGVILVKLERFFGIPKSTLYFLASLPLLFATFDFYCYFKIERNLDTLLKSIAIINLLYCFLSIGLAFYDYQKITNLGWAYIIIEVLIVTTIAIIELKASKKYNLKQFKN